MASIGITPETGAVTLTPRWSIGPNLAGFHQMAQDLGLGGEANDFYSITNEVIPDGGNILAFNLYVAGSGSATPHADIGSKLTPDSYSALSSADPDVGYGSVNFYLIHHKGTTDYFTAIIPGSATSSAVTDLKPMSAPGGPDTVTGVSGYFGLTFAASNLGYGLNNFYYLRTDPESGATKFGTLEPALLGTSADQFELDDVGYKALTFTGTDVGYGTDKMYYVRLDPITGYSILGMLDPALAGVRHTSDIANLGSVYSTLTFVPGDIFGANQFYTTGAINPTWQSVSFAAIPDRLISEGAFNVNPTASSGLAVTLTVVKGSVGAASIVDVGGGVFTVTPTAPGLITLQATQAGQFAPIDPAYEYNMLRQSFLLTGVATLRFDIQPTPQIAVVGSTAEFNVEAGGDVTISYVWRKNGVAIDAMLNPSAATGTLSLANVQVADADTYDVVITNSSGSIISDAVTLTVTTSTPIIINQPLTSGGTVGVAYNFTITTSGMPTSYTASPLPAGLTFDSGTGVISGTPTTAGTTQVLLGATDGSTTGNSTVTITIAAVATAPVIVNDPLAAGGTVGDAFSFTITASGSPSSFTASPLPAGLSINTMTGVISGTPTTVGTTTVTLGATNGTATANATLTIKVATTGIAPVIINTVLTADGTTGTAFNYNVAATGTPTSYTASPLPAGLSINLTTGAITGIPTAVASTVVTLGATNAYGTGTASLTIDVVAGPVLGFAPVITNDPLTASGIVGNPFSYTITATESPLSYTASPLPAGLSIDSDTGIISGTPSAGGVVVATISATNLTGTTNGTLTITVIGTLHVPVSGSVGVIDLTNGAGAPPDGTIYVAKGLPKGLVLDRNTGLVTGTSTKAGTYQVTYYTLTGRKTKGPIQTLTIVIDPFPAELSGKFETILDTPPSPGVPAAKLELTVNSKSGAFTGKLTTALDAKPIAVRGTLSLNETFDAGIASVIIKHRGGPFQLDIAIDSTQDDSHVFLATVQQSNVTLGESDTGVKLSSLSADWAGNYSMVLSDPSALPENIGLGVAPEGTGFAQITVNNSNGQLIAKGYLGDGTKLTASLAASTDGSYRWFVKPYKRGGSFAGWVQFVAVADDVAPYQVVGTENSELYWTKDAFSRDKSYRAGFGPVVLAATLQRWSAPDRNTTLSVSLNLEDGLLVSSFTSDNLPSEDAALLPVLLGLNDNNNFVVAIPGSNSNEFSAKALTFNGQITSANGLFIGSFTLQDSRKVSVYGILLQQPVVEPGTVIGEGYFVIPSTVRRGESTTGKIQFVAPDVL